MILAFLLLCSVSFSQPVKLIESGSIEFEKTINMYAIYKKTDENNFEDYRNRNPQFISLKSTLLFEGQQTLFTPRDIERNAMINNVTPFPFGGQLNLVYSDLSSKSSITQKKIYEETILVKDSIRQIKWKLTDEFRDIAGFNCRRANALIMDSIYVVAFYTNEIHVSGGPESFSGLPGMILQVALPHENVIWTATKVIEGGVPPNAIVPPVKGKGMKLREFGEMLEGLMKSFDKKLKDLLIKDLLI